MYPFMVLYLGRMCQCRLQARGILIRFSCCRTSQYCRTFIPLSVSLWNDLADTGGFQEQGQCIFIGLSCSILFYLLSIFPFIFFLSIDRYCGAGVFGLVGCRSLSLSLALLPSFHNNNSKYCLPYGLKSLLSFVVQVFYLKADCKYSNPKNSKKKCSDYLLILILI